MWSDDLERPDPEVQRAVAKLLRATQDFTSAYEAWSQAPRGFEVERRAALDRAEERLEQAQHDVVRAEADRIGRSW